MIYYFDDFSEFSLNYSSKLFDKIQFYVFTLKTKYSQNNFRQSSRIAKFSNKIFSKVKKQNFQEFKHKALLNPG